MKSKMARKGKEIRNPITGQSIHFVQTKADTNGQLLEIISTYEARSIKPVLHYHPNQDEYFEVLQGELSVRLNDTFQTFGPGEKIHIEKNTIHAMWNATDEKTVVTWKTIPALNTENFLELTTGLVNDGKTNGNGIPNIFQVALMMIHYNQEFRLAKPPFAIQKIVFILLKPLAHLLGYKPFYWKYID